MLKVAIIDDEKNSRDALKACLQHLPHEIKIVGEANSVKNGLELLSNAEIDVLFLDIEMPDGSGFDLLDKLDKINFNLILATAFNQYAIKAFRYAALDYLLKPVQLNELEEALSRIVSLPKQDNDKRVDLLLENHHSNNSFKRLAIATTEGVYYFELDKIIRCEAEGGYTYIFAENHKPILASKNIKEYESILPDNFLRVHKSHLVNATFVEKFDARETKLLLKNETQVLVARRRKSIITDYFSARQ